MSSAHDGRSITPRADVSPVADPPGPGAAIEHGLEDARGAGLEAGPYVGCAAGRGEARDEHVPR